MFSKTMLLNFTCCNLPLHYVKVKMTNPQDIAYCEYETDFYFDAICHKLHFFVYVYVYAQARGRDRGVFQVRGLVTNLGTFT